MFQVIRRSRGPSWEPEARSERCRDESNRVATAIINKQRTINRSLAHILNGVPISRFSLRSLCDSLRLCGERFESLFTAKTLRNAEGAQRISIETLPTSSGGDVLTVEDCYRQQQSAKDV